MADVVLYFLWTSLDLSTGVGWILVSGVEDFSDSVGLRKKVLVLLDLLSSLVVFVRDSSSMTSLNLEIPFVLSEKSTRPPRI